MKKGLVKIGLVVLIAAGFVGLAKVEGTEAGKTKIRVIFISKQNGLPGWPTAEFDPFPRAGLFKEKLSKFKDYEFIGNDVVLDMGKLSEIKRNLSNEDGLLIFHLTSGGNAGALLVEIMGWDFPKVLYNDLYGGDCDFLGLIAQKILPMEKPRAIYISSSDFGDVERKLNLIRTIQRLKESHILCVGQPMIDSAYAAKDSEAKLGVKITQLGWETLNDAYDAANIEEAKKIAAQWFAKAERVLEPSKEDIIKACKLYLGIKSLMEEEGANLATIDCLHGVYEGKIDAYPCLAWTMLYDQGLWGICEADLASSLTQLIVGFIANRPGYMFDPVLDTSNNTIIACHCVAPTRMAGIDKPPEPYIIRSHAEDRKGASVQVKMKEGQVITLVKFVPFDKMFISTGKIIGNLDLDERACRTKVIIKMDNDVKKMLDNYSGGLHRIMFYGNWVEDIKDLSKLLSYTVIEE